MTEWERQGDRAIRRRPQAHQPKPLTKATINLTIPGIPPWPLPDLGDDRTGISVRYTPAGYRWYLLYADRKNGIRIAYESPTTYPTATEAETAGRPVADEAASYLHHRVYLTNGEPT